MRWMFEAKVAIMILPRVFCEDVLECAADFLFREGESAFFGIGAVREHQESAFLPVAGEGMKIHQFAVYRRRIELEVSGMDHIAERGFDAERYSVDDAVGDADEFNGK